MRRAVNERTAACKQLLSFMYVCVVCVQAGKLHRKLSALAYLLPASCVGASERRVRAAALLL
jgi:hypothetical protein